MSLQTFPGSDLNRISGTVQKYLDDRTLKLGEIVKYRLLNGVKNIDPQKEKGSEILYPAVVSFTLKDDIYDPGDEGKNNGRLVQVGVVKGYNEITRQFTFRKFAVAPQKGDGGMFMLRGGVVDDMAIYDGLELSNHNAGNPFRDTSTDLIFERVNEIKESGARSTRRNHLFDSLTAIRNWDYTQMKVMAAAYNISPTLPMEVLKDKLEAIAETNPETFALSLDSEDLKVRAIVKIGRDADVISFIPHENKWIYSASGENLVILDRREGISETDQFVDFIKNSTNGRLIKQNIEKLINTKKKEKV